MTVLLVKSHPLKENKMKWFLDYGSLGEVTPFKHLPKRNIGDEFKNVNNDIATMALACNNNVTLGDRADFFYESSMQITEILSVFSCVGINRALRSY